MTQHDDRQGSAPAPLPHPLDCGVTLNPRIMAGLNAVAAINNKTVDEIAREGLEFYLGFALPELDDLADELESELAEVHARVEVEKIDEEIARQNEQMALALLANRANDLQGKLDEAGVEEGAPARDHLQKALEGIKQAGALAQILAEEGKRRRGERAAQGGSLQSALEEVKRIDEDQRRREKAVQTSATPDPTFSAGVSIEPGLDGFTRVRTYAQGGALLSNELMPSGKVVAWLQERIKREEGQR